MDIKRTLRALKNPNYRLFFGGQLVSLTGTWMQNMAMAWLVYRLTDSAFALGVIGFSSQVTIFFLTPLAGVCADQWNRRKILILTQTLAMAQSFILAFLVLSGAVRVWHIITLSVFLGLVSSFDMPVRQSFTVDMIEDKQDLGNAIALNSMMFNIARFIGPALAGMLVLSQGEGICFLINGFSYCAVIIALLLMSSGQKPQGSGAGGGVVKRFKEGFSYSFSHPSIRVILMMMSLISLAVMPYAVLLPVLARDVLGGNSRTQGFLMAFAGLGALAGALTLASRTDARGLSRTILRASFIVAAGLIILSFSRVVWLSLAVMAVIGFGIMLQMASSNTILQTICDDDKRGRVMGFYVMAFIGLTPFGSLLAGAVASRIGTTPTVFSSGMITLAAALVFLRAISSDGFLRGMRILECPQPGTVNEGGAATPSGV